MAVPIIIADDFAVDAEAVRQAVIAGGFSTEAGPDGAEYTGISEYAVPQWFERIAEILGVAKITPRLSCFRLNLKGELPHSWVHSDDICAQFASVLYLNPPEQCSGGTAFWKHRVLGWERLFQPQEIAQHGVDEAAYHALVTREWKVLDAWQPNGFVGMQFNRFVTYPTSYFHSRFPFEGFGGGPSDGRLIWVCFYDLRAKD
jgi:hypothetical protein